MNSPVLTVPADLHFGRDSISVEASYLSRYSILIRFLNGKVFPDEYIFSRLVLHLNGTNVKLGPCKFLKNGDPTGKKGKVVFIKDIYDLDDLFYHKSLVKLQSAFMNVPLILGHKDNIRPEFREYTANLTYDLNVYKDLFDQVDQQISGEPEDVKKVISKSMIDIEGRKFMVFLDEKLSELEQLVSGYSTIEHERHGFYFRKQLWNLITTSPIMIRTNLKPRGYAGDFEMMRMIYENNYCGDTIFGMLMHKHPVEHAGAKAVRTRRKLIAQSFYEIEKSKKWQGEQKIRILSVACGPAYELQDISVNSENHRRFQFTLLDQDPEALDAAKQQVQNIEKHFGIKLDTQYLNESVRTMLTTRDISEKWGSFNFVYSMGLFDYLTPPAARVVLKKLFELLKPGGEMIIGNFHVSNPSRAYMEYWLDWVLYYRTEEEFMSLLSDEPAAKCSVFFENTGSQMFLHVKKDA